MKNRFSTFSVFACLVTFVTLPNFAQSQSSKPCSAMSLGANASLNGFIPFPANDPWRQNVTNAAIDPNSANILNTIGTTTPLHPDFGSGQYDGSYTGIPYQVVSQQAKVPVTYTAYGSESDQGPMPIPANVPIEGYPAPAQTGSFDQHALVLDRDNCFLYELDGTYITSSGAVTAASGAIWDLKNDNARPWGWTSADAAGLPVFPGLARYDEAAAGAIQHALRFTLNRTTYAAVVPAKHSSGKSGAAYVPPMGMRMRLKASFNITGFTPQAQVILQALKTYGMILADNGGSGYLSGAPNDGWNNDDLHTLGQVTFADFDVLTEGTEYNDANYPTGPAPAIAAFNATASGKAGASVTLDWQVSGASYYVISPSVGAIRGLTTTVAPKATTTYTLYATNQYGQTTATTTVTVPGSTTGPKKAK